MEWSLFQLVSVGGSDTELRSRAFRLFSATFSLFAAHFDPNDIYKIQNLTTESLHENIERFQLVFEGFFAGEMPDLGDFNERNPLLSAGS